MAAMTYGGLAKLIEEAGELQQVIGKIFAYPHEGLHPDNKGALTTRFIEELADTIAVCLFIKTTMFDHPRVINTFFENKSESKFEKYLEKSTVIKELGELAQLLGKITELSATLILGKTDAEAEILLELSLSPLVEKGVSFPRTKENNQVFYSTVDTKLRKYFLGQEEE